MKLAKGSLTETFTLYTKAQFLISLRSKMKTFYNRLLSKMLRLSDHMNNVQDCI